MTVWLLRAASLSSAGAACWYRRSPRVPVLRAALAMKRAVDASADVPDKKARADSSDGDEPILPIKAPGTSTAKGAPKPKLASIFQPRSTSSAAGTCSSGSGLKWLSPIGPAKSCLHGVYGEPAPSAKVAFYDLDGTIVRPKGGKTFPSKTDEYDFEFLFSSPRAGLGGASSDRSVIARIRQQHAQQFAIVLITNQKQTAYSAKNGLATWKKKMAHIAAAIDVPMRVFAALGDDAYRKPRLGSWVEFTERWNGGVEVDRESSFFVGDAAGRSKYRDHQDTDLKWALNARISFFTPEEYFLGKDKEYEVPARPWSPSALKPGPSLKGLVALPEDEMVSVDLSDLDDGKDGRRIVLGDGASGSEIVLFVGAPASGKTFLFQRVFAPAHYVHVNQDALRTRDKCLHVVADTIAAGQSCVVDNTNRDRATRKHYIELARQTGARIRCVYFDVPKHVCVHNNHFRAHHGPSADHESKREILPFTAIDSWFKQVQPPGRSEGFDADVLRITWRFHGKDDVQTKYNLYYH